MKFKFMNLTSLAIAAATLMTSCATIVNGTHQPIGVSTTPCNANVYIDNYYIGESPLIVALTRKDNHFVRIELEGFEPYETVLTRKVSGWVFGNIVIGGVIGLAIDAISGGIYKLTPEQIDTHLQANQYHPQQDESFIYVVLKADPSWEKVGELKKAN